ncbi:MAG: hypothetical protein VKM92_05545 [Cyanobacteriota bacterium]|nr:hypothetical protein [Cyanobacteriota bacterium]
MRPSTPTQWRIEPLAGWHLPLLGDPAFLPLQALLQRAALLDLPERLLRWLGRGQPHAPQVLVAFADHSQTALGLVVCRPLNRTGSCWQVAHLRTSRSEFRHALSSDLLKAALQRTPTPSWVASAASDDSTRLAVLREQGFQPLRQDQLWCWSAAAQSAAAVAGPAAGTADCLGDLQLQPLNRRTASLHWHLEQIVCPAQLRQILDRRSDDVLAQSHGKGWVLVDPSREGAVAGARWLGEHPGGGHDIELTVDPHWSHLYGAATTLLLQRLLAGGLEPGAVWLRSDPYDHDRLQWLLALGAQQRGERVLMARSLWRRRALPNLEHQANRRLEAVLAQLQPRRRPVPTPLLPR